MKTTFKGFLFFAMAYLSLVLSYGQENTKNGITVPFFLDHNRMLVDAEIQGNDGNWRMARLWVDTGNPDFFLSPALAHGLGINQPSVENRTGDSVPHSPNVRIGGMTLDFRGVALNVVAEPFWLFSAMHNDANLPSTVLKRYQVVFDYPKRELAIAMPGSLQHRGDRSPADVNNRTGIVQIDAVIDGDSSSFALDNGASFSFVSGELLERLSKKHPNWPRITGTAGCANMWGWWPPDEQTMTVMRLPEIRWGSALLNEVALVGVPAVALGGPSLGAWYSEKTAHPVAGFLGPNAFKCFRVEIDYANHAVYFEKGPDYDPHDLDVVGVVLRPEADSSYSIIGVSKIDGKPVVGGIQPGDKLIQVDGLTTAGVTMGRVVDALRGKPGEIRTLILKRNGKRLEIKTEVKRLL